MFELSACQLGTYFRLILPFCHPNCEPDAALCLRCAPQATNKEQNITIKSSGGLSDEQVEQMVRDAETFAGEDKKRKDGIEAKNEAETLVYSAEKSLNEYKVQHLSSRPTMSTLCAIAVSVCRF